MAMQHTFFGRGRSVVGTALIGLGILVLHENLDRAASQLSHLFGTPGKTLGIPPTVILAAFRVLQAYASDHQRFLEGFFQHTLLTFWPLLLVIIGGALSQEAFRDNADARSGKNQESVDLIARQSTLK